MFQETTDQLSVDGVAPTPGVSGETDGEEGDGREEEEIHLDHRERDVLRVRGLLDLMPVGVIFSASSSRLVKNHLKLF